MLQLILLLWALSLSILVAERGVPGTGGLRGHDTHPEEEDRKLTSDIGNPDDRNTYQLPSHRGLQTTIQVHFTNFHHLIIPSIPFISILFF